jgi:hypothetical protein
LFLILTVEAEKGQKKLLVLERKAEVKLWNKLQ